MIVGLLGFIGSGKGTVGNILHDDYGFKKVSFANHLKDVAALMFGWPRDLLEGETKESREFREIPDVFWSERMGKPFTPRLALQLFGTEAARNVFHEDFWILSLEREMLKHPNTNFVITDVRFQNEIEFVNKMNGILIEVERGFRPHWYDIAAQANRGSTNAEKFMRETEKIHESEWRWIGCAETYSVQNDGTLVDLKNKTDKVLIDAFGLDTIRAINMTANKEQFGYETV